MFLLIDQKGKYIHITNCQLGRQHKKTILKLMKIETVLRALRQLGYGGRGEGTPSHGQVSCDLSCQVQSDLRL
jgi:hypothetical protein